MSPFGAQNIVRQAEVRNEKTKNFTRKVKSTTCRKFTPEEKIRIVMEGFRHVIHIRELCRREGIRPNMYYARLKDFVKARKKRLQYDTARDATILTYTARLYVQMIAEMRMPIS